jgi:hypothetical protein
VSTDEVAVLPGRAPQTAPQPRRFGGRARVRARPERQPAVAVEVDGPHIRLGIVWAIALNGAMLGGPGWVAVLMAPVVALAAASTMRSWHERADAPDAARRAERPLPVQPTLPVAAAAAGLITLMSAAGPAPAIGAGVLAAVAIAAGSVFGPRGVPRPAYRMLAILLPAAAGCGVVLSRAQGLPAGLVLAGMACVYDSAAYLIGTGAGNEWEGPVAGVASIGVLSLFVAAVLVPPFRGASPWVLGGMAAVLAPIGPVVARRLARDPSARVPALRRLDSLLLLGPAWAIGAALLLRV